MYSGQYPGPPNGKLKNPNLFYHPNLFLSRLSYHLLQLYLYPFSISILLLFLQNRYPLKISIFAGMGPNLLYCDVPYLLSCINKLTWNLNLNITYGCVRLVWPYKNTSPRMFLNMSFIISDNLYRETEMFLEIEVVLLNAHYFAYLLAKPWSN